MLKPWRNYQHLQVARGCVQDIILTTSTLHNQFFAKRGEKQANLVVLAKIIIPGCASHAHSAYGRGQVAIHKEETRKL